MVPETYTNTLLYYQQVSDKRLPWEFFKIMEIKIQLYRIRSTKQKCPETVQMIAQLNYAIYNDFYSQTVTTVDNKLNLNSVYR